MWFSVTHVDRFLRCKKSSHVRHTNKHKRFLFETKGDVMDQAISTVVPLFRATDTLFHDALAGIERADLLRRPHDNSNPLIWVAGHAIAEEFRVTDPAQAVLILRLTQV